MLKSRSPHACVLCRQRKVRCDVARTGIPCSNCSRTPAQCSVSAVRKGRLTQEPPKNTLPSTSVYTFEIDLPTTKSDPVCDTRAPNATAPDTLPCRPTPETTPAISALSQTSASYEEQWVYASPPLPGFITPVPQELEQDVLQLLQRQGAFTLPDQAMMEELLRAYFHYVQPLLPLLDSDHFLDAIHGKTSSTISLLLFQAVMFAGATFVDLEQLDSMGFNSHDDGRRALFKRVKLLYEMDTDLDPLTMIQVLLLMTYWYGQQNDTKGRFYWLRIARSLALDIGLDRDSKPSANHSQDPFRRRLWYCYIVRDTLLSLTERRLGGLRDTSLDVRALRPEDFQEVGSGEAVYQYYMPAQKIEASTATRLWFQKVKLCLIIQRILNFQYELNGLRRVDSTETFLVLVPKKSSSAADEAVVRDQELHEWRSETTSVTGLCFGRDHRCNGRFLAVHFSTVEMLYCTAVSMVHRPQLLQDRPRESAAGALQAFSALALRSAARRISEIGRHMQEGALVQFLPPIVVGSLIISSIQHLKDALSMDTELRSTGHLYLNQTLDAFAALKDMYNSVDCALGFIERVRSGKLPYHSFEWENSTESVPRVSEVTSGEPILGEYCNATNDERVALSHEQPFNGGEYTANGMAFAPSSNIDAISELLLYAPYDASQTEWASMDWMQPEAQVF